MRGGAGVLGAGLLASAADEFDLGRTSWLHEPDGPDSIDLTETP